MFCKQCGAELTSGAKFCPNCGTPISIEEKTACLNTIQVKCKSCNSVMSVDRDKQVMVCPYCGSHELIIENDAVTIERIKSQTILKKQEAAHRFQQEDFSNREQWKAEKEKRGWKVAAILWGIWIVLFIAVMIYAKIK